MTDSTLDRLGQAKGKGANDALFLKLGIAELIAAFDRENVFKGKVRERNIKGGKSAAFPVAGKATAGYHTPGSPILGSADGDRNEMLINLDSLLISSRVIYDLDELMNYWDVRQDITHQLGEALAREWDMRAARVLYAAASTTDEVLGKAHNTGRTGQTQTLSAAYANANTTAKAKGDELIAKISALKISMKKKDVPTKNLMCAVGPEEYDLLLESTRGINTDFNAGGGMNGSFGDGRIMRVKGIPVIESNHVTQANYDNVAGDKNTAYEQNLSKCVAIVWHRDAIGVLTLKSPSLQIAGGNSTFGVMYQGTLMVGRMAIGMGVLRPECAGVVVKA